MSMPMPMPVLPARRRGSKAITDVLTKFSIDRAAEQFKAEEGGPGGGGGDEEEGGDSSADGARRNRQRASVYVLMHAIAAVDTANDEAFGDAEPLDGVEEPTAEAAI